jgi:hypothetical protein
MSSLSDHRQPRSIAATVLAACACALAVSACGASSGSGGSDGSSGTNGGSKAAQYQSALSFSRCMRSHGLKNFPDPQAGGGGIRVQISPSTGVNPSAPAFHSAQKNCQHLLPGGGPSNQKPSEQDKQQMLALANCMRAHGLTNFPDPTTTQPKVSSAAPGKGQFLGINGLFFNFGSADLDPQSPAFLRAAQACHFPGVGRSGSVRALSAIKGD